MEGEILGQDTVVEVEDRETPRRYYRLGEDGSEMGSHWGHSLNSDVINRNMNRLL